jgi:hypothetical protein
MEIAGTGPTGDQNLELTGDMLQELTNAIEDDDDDEVIPYSDKSN